MKEIKAKLEDVKRVDTAGQDHAGYLSDGIGVLWQRKNAGTYV